MPKGMFSGGGKGLRIQKNGMHEGALPLRIKNKKASLPVLSPFEVRFADPYATLERQACLHCTRSV